MYPSMEGPSHLIVSDPPCSAHPNRLCCCGDASCHSFLVGGRQEPTQLIESPYLMHPIEHKTAGLYKAPVACLDFASLYPSIYRWAGRFTCIDAAALTAVGIVVACAVIVLIMAVSMLRRSRAAAVVHGSPHSIASSTLSMHALTNGALPAGHTTCATQRWWCLRTCLLWVLTMWRPPPQAMPSSSRMCGR
jgi:hypothetical protein